MRGEKKQRYYYRDFMTGKRHFTCAPFGGWTEPMGPLMCRYAWFLCLSGDLFIPEYLLDPATKALLEQRVAEAKQQEETKIPSSEERP